MTKTSRSWICCQLGAREHYAVPRALHESDTLQHLFTDAWVKPGNLVGRANYSLRERYHSQLANAFVGSATGALLGFEALATAKGLRGWRRITKRNQWFQRRAIRALSMSLLIESANRRDSPQTLFAYSYAALKILRYAKRCGCRTVLGQIDPGPVEEQIVAEEVAREPLLGAQWQRAPDGYWHDWQEECELADDILVNSQWSRDCLIGSGVSPEKVKIIPLAFEPAMERPQSSKVHPHRFTSARPLRVLFLGQVNLRKGIARLLRAARALREEPIEFIVVGPIQIQNARKVASDCHVRWVGSVPRQRASAFYEHADVFMLPTLSDGFAITQLEALAHRLPVIASRKCGEVVQHRVNGLILEEPTTEAIIEILLHCVKNPGLVEAFSQAASVREEFSLRALGDGLLTL